MNKDQIKEKMNVLFESCPCGSGKMFYACCGTDQAELISNEKCPCGSGKMVKDCCMKNPESHKEM